MDIWFKEVKQLSYSFKLQKVNENARGYVERDPGPLHIPSHWVQVQGGF